LLTFKFFSTCSYSGPRSGFCHLGHFKYSYDIYIYIYISRYVFSYPGQLTLSVLSWESAASTSQRAVTPCGWGVKAGTVRVWVAGKTA